MTDTEQRDERVVEEIVNGRSLRAVQRQFSLTAAELDVVLEKAWPVDSAARLRMVRADLGKLDKLISVFFEKAIGGCTQSGLVAIRVLERKHDLLGLNSASKIELQVIQAAQEKPGHERIYEVIMECARGPNWRENRGNDSPLENDGAVDALSAPDDAKPNH